MVFFYILVERERDEEGESSDASLEKLSYNLKHRLLLYATDGIELTVIDYKEMSSDH